VALETIAPAELHALTTTAAVRLIDVRTPAEFHRRHARGATNVPADRLDAAALTASGGPVYLICRGGTRAAEVSERLAAEAPAVRTVVVEGGTLAWEATGLPVEKAFDWRAFRRRSNRIGAALVGVSIVLSVLVHRGLLGLAGFAGAALVANMMIANHFLERAYRAEIE
jgi:rhodanese-related sulfurtransferase